MRSINPGEELVYEFEANYAGVFMYHCGTAPALHHIASGMFGMSSRAAGGLPPVDHEFALVQSEWYLGEQSACQPGQGFGGRSRARLRGLERDRQPVQGPPHPGARGETVRVFVLNAGPSIDSSFHVVGTIFEDVIKEGMHLERGNDGNWGSQAVDLAPAQGAIVEMHFDEDGLYPIVTHAFNFVGRAPLASSRRAMAARCLPAATELARLRRF